MFLNELYKNHHTTYDYSWVNWVEGRKKLHPLVLKCVEEGITGAEVAAVLKDMNAEDYLITLPNNKHDAKAVSKDF